VTPANYRATDSYAHAVRVGRLRGRRSQDARANYRAVVHAFVAAGHARLLTGATMASEIKRVYCQLMVEADGWDHVDTRAESFLTFVRRNPEWIAAVAEGTAP
jgi:hypothetical protein